MPDREAHLVLLPSIVEVHNLHAGPRGELVHLGEFTTRQWVVAKRLCWSLDLNVGHQFKIGESINSTFPINLLSSIVDQERVLVLEIV